MATQFRSTSQKNTENQVSKRLQMIVSNKSKQLTALEKQITNQSKTYVNNLRTKFVSLQGNRVHWSNPEMVETQQAKSVVKIAGRTSLFTYINSIGGSNTHFMVKRAMDIVVSLLVLGLTLPVLLFIAAWIKYDSKGPVIFKQERLTSRRVFKDGKYVWTVVPFTIYKFRTMSHNASTDVHKQFVKAFISNDEKAMNDLQKTDERDNGQFKLSNDSRVTRSGNFLRKTSLDELPQFFNVLLGDMTLVGPRPALDYEVEEYADWQMLRLACKQGITGYWQVTGRSESTFDNMIKQDIWYACHQSLWLDLKILVMTPIAVLKGKGAG